MTEADDDRLLAKFRQTIDKAIAAGDLERARRELLLLGEVAAALQKKTPATLSEAPAQNTGTTTQNVQHTPSYCKD
jgi:hypothetical protein